MTDHKSSSSWLWKKKSSEKTAIAENNEPPASIKYEQEIHVLQAEKAELEKDLNELNNKLSSIHVECEAKDELAKRHSKTAQEALSGWEKAEAKALSIRQDLNEAIQQKTATEEKNIQLDTSLKECMEQLRFTREDQERRMHDALVKVSDDFEESRLFLEQKLAESNKTLDELAADNARLHDELLLKDRLLEELSDQRTKADADFSSLISRLESVEKENGSLRYEVRVLEKEVDFRNEEREFNRRSTDATHKQHLENVKKIAKLESECQKLRVLVRKRLPGPAAVAKMKNQVQMLERDSTTAADLGRGRRKAIDKNPRSLDHDDSNNSHNSPELMPTEKKINALTEKISALEEESKGLKEMLLTKSNQLQTLRNMYSRSALKLSQVEAQLEDSSSRGQAVVNTDLRRNSMDLRRSSLTSHDIISEIGSNCDDKASSCAGSWTSALISELEQFKGGRKNTDGLPSPCKSVAVSDISLMDDFAEMEKLALVCVDKTRENNSLTHISNNDNNEGNNLASRSLDFSKAAGANRKELIPNSNDDTRFDSHKGGMQSKLHTSVSRLIEIIEGISNLLQTRNSTVSLMSSPEDGNSFTCKGSEDMSGFMVRIFQWKVSELSPILQSIHHVCDDVLNGKTNIDVLIQEMTSTLEWLVDHCFSLQDVSSMKDAIKKHFNSDESRSEGEVDIGTTLAHVSEAAGRLPCLKEELVAADDKAEEVSEETKDGSNNVKPSIKESEQRVAPAIDGRKSFINDIQKTENAMGNLEVELEELKQSKRLIEEEIEKQKLINEDLDTQLSDARIELNEAYQKIPRLESQLEDKCNRCEELEARCLDLELQLESMTEMDTSKTGMNEEEKQVQPESQITAASERLAQCQETILNLGKQFKALASPRDASLFDKVISTPIGTEDKSELSPTSKMISQRSSLLDQMLAEDDVDVEQLESPKTKEVICASDTKELLHPQNDTSNSASDLNGVLEPAKEQLRIVPGEIQHNGTGAGVVGPLAIVPVKKQNGGLFRKLLWRKRKTHKKKMAALPWE